MVFQHLKQIKKVKEKKKKTGKGCLMCSLGEGGIHHIAVSTHILHNNNKPFLDQIVVCNEKWILYDIQRWPA